MLTLMLYTQPVITQTSVPCYFIHTASSRMHFLSHSTKQVFSLDLLSLTFPVTVLFPFKAFSKLFLLYDAKISQISVYSLYYSVASFHSVTICDVFGFVNLFWLLCLWINLIKCFIIIIFIQPLLYNIACWNIFFTLILAHKCRC